MDEKSIKDMPGNLALTAMISSAYFQNNPVPPSEIPAIINAVSHTLAGIERGAASSAAEEPPAAPAVSIRTSVKPDYMVCLECGQRHKMLKRHLGAQHGLSPEQYRAKWGLPASYPMAAPNYREQRRELALAIGLGKR